MEVQIARIEDFEDWIRLAKEVEPIFGPMSEEISFHSALKEFIFAEQAFCIKNDSEFFGAIVISKQENDILWFAVSQKHKGKGYGKLLLQYAINKLDSSKDITVQTFAKDIDEGVPARKLYESFGFVDLKPGDKNPAGYNTVFMVKFKSLSC